MSSTVEGNKVTTAETASSCSKCGLPMSGQFVRALGELYHLNCFTCQDCKKNVASRFFPLQENGKTYPLCEKDYFSRLQLICANCGNALRGNYISAAGKKYHLEHFTCSKCTTVFGPDETYYEHEGNIYCNLHYSLDYAAKCVGCKTAILKQFVEAKNGEDEKWHPDCYMIYKSWNIKLNSCADLNDQNKNLVIQEKVNKIWTVLSAFEESAASCISDMLLHVSNQCFVDAVTEAGHFILHVEVLFAGIDQLEEKMKRFSDNIGLNHAKEPKMLSKKIVNFFSLLSHTQNANFKQYSSVTQELLGLVTSLAQYLKVLIRIALAGALKLESHYHETTAIGDFLNALVELGRKENNNSSLSLNFDQRFNISDTTVKSDLCHVCKLSVEDECYKHGPIRWHKQCFLCHTCSQDLSGDYLKAHFDQAELHIFCPSHAVVGSLGGVVNFVTQLGQYTFLLRVALKRLYSLLKVKDDSSALPISQNDQDRHSDSASKVAARSMSDSHTKKPELPQIKIAMEATPETEFAGEKPIEQSVEKFKATQKSVHNLIEQSEGPLGDIIQEAVISHSSSLPNFDDSSFEKRHKEEQKKWPMSSPLSLAKVNASRDSLKNKNDLVIGNRKIIYLAELSALETFIAKHVAVLKIQPLVQDYFAMPELLDMIKDRKTSFWSRILDSFKPSKKHVAKDGVFGIPIETLVEKFGVDSKHGNGRIKIPHFIDQTISAMKKMNLRTEGIFRKNGNIKNLASLQEKIDKDPWGVDFTNETPIQIAALLKKFLRELPEPILTNKLYKLFIMSQKIPNVESRRKILHYICCLLPKANRDLVEVLVSFLREVSAYAGGEDGNKMDVNNLATVIAPNLLYSKTKDRLDRTNAMDESFLAIDAIKMLINCQDFLWTVPDDISDILSSTDISDANDLTSKDVLKRCEPLLTNKKAHSSRDVYENKTVPQGTGATSTRIVERID